MIRFLFSLVIFLGLSSIAISQSDFAQPEQYVSGRLQVLGADFSDLNTSIIGEFPTLQGQILGIGVGAGRKYGWLYGGLTGMKYMGFESNSVLGRSTKFSGYSFGVNLKLDVWRLGNFRLQLFTETGLRKYNLTLHESSTLSIEDVLQDEINNIRFENLDLYSDWGLGVSQSFDMLNTKVGISLSGGYRVDRGKWKYEGVNELSQPVADMSGFFGLFRITFIPIG